MTDRASSPHAQHDLELIAAFASGDAEGTDRARAGELVASCPACAELAADLPLLARAVSDLPAPARTRDFRLRPEDAARLRPRGWRRLLAAVGPSRLELARPLAPVFMTLGIVGLLVSAAPIVQLGTVGFGGAAAGSSMGAARASAAASTTDTGNGAQVVAPAAASAAPSASGSRSSTADYGVSKSATTASANPAASAAGDTTAEGGSGAYITGVPDSAAPPVQVTSGPQPNLPLAALSLAALVLGIALFALRRAARPA